MVGNRARELSKGWRQDYYGLDKRDSDPSISDSGWRLTSNDQLVVDIGQQIAVDGFKRQVFEEAIREWASKAQNDAVVSELLEKAFWTKSNFNATEEFAVVDKILQMEEGGERGQSVFIIGPSGSFVVDIWGLILCRPTGSAGPSGSSASIRGMP